MVRYRFTGKGLFYAAGCVCFLSIILIPLGLFFMFAASKAFVGIDGDTLVYRMFTTKRIPFASITKIRVANAVKARYYMGSGVNLNLVTVVPLIVEYGEKKKIQLSLNFFERSQEILATLEHKTGLKLELPL
jgi:hypothetical protein